MERKLGNFGFFRVAVASPEHEVTAVDFNLKHIIILIDKALVQNCGLILFPELSITGYTCGDLFYSEKLICESLKAIEKIREYSKNKKIIIAVGSPIMVQGKLFNCGILIYDGELIGIVPKTFLPNTLEYYEKRWFSSEFDRQTEEININGKQIPFGADLLFSSEKNNDIIFGIEICEDLWAVKPPSSDMAAAGANILLNLSAGDEYLGKDFYRKQLVIGQSGRCLAAYIYSSAGPGESTTDLVFSGQCLIAENGILLTESNRFDFSSQLIIQDIDIERLNLERRRNNSFVSTRPEKYYRIINIDLPKLNAIDFLREISPTPFIPAKIETRSNSCREIFLIQSTALAKRLKFTGLKNAVLGISGGLDSTLALLVTVKAFEKLSLELNGIHALIMPGFGTTERTKSNAEKLAELLGVNKSIISITKSVLQHFKDIGHDINKFDIVYENSQARERTQILMDYANKVNGLVIGTGDLSELALGWCTYSGDHISNYGVNSGVPKTLVKYIIEWCAEVNFEGEISKTLKDICSTPISPELLPAGSEGEILQKTEESIGPYILHDFFLYYFVKWHFSPEKILLLAKTAFNGIYAEEEIKKWLKVFIKRFFEQQFKRSCLPDGVKVGTVSLSPRGDWRMPSDASNEIWLKF